jgi:hypothetical protein
LQRRNINIFGLSFLDIMFCGFGSVILLVMIVNSNMVKYREQAISELKAEADRIEQELETKQELLVKLKNSEVQSNLEIIKTQGLSEQVLQAITAHRQQLGEQNQNTTATREHIKKLQSDLKSLEQGNRVMQAQLREQSKKTGTKFRRIKGEGDRQYLTGIKMGGKRVLILVDRSASMLDETIVNIIVKRNQSRQNKLAARKWRRVVATVEWLLSQLPPSSQYQLVVFNQQRKHLIPNKGWLKATDANSMNQIMTAMGKIIPENGTSLYQAFQAIKTMQPRPDNIFLITDGLPTLGKTGSSKTRVSGEQRLEYFADAVKEIPRGIPVNTILFQIEGDPMAASAFWKLTVQTKGSLVSPAKDWP